MATSATFYRSQFFSADGRFILDRSAMERPESSFRHSCTPFSSKDEFNTKWNMQLILEKEGAGDEFRLPGSAKIAWEITAALGYEYVNFMVKMEVRQETCDGKNIVSEHPTPWTSLKLIKDSCGNTSRGCSGVVVDFKLDPSLSKLHISASVTWRSQKIQAFTTNVIPEDHTTLIRKLEGLQLSEKHSDVVFIVGEEEIPAHRLILAVMSDVFSNMFELDTQDKRTGRVEVTDASPAAFRRMLRSLYSGDDPFWAETKDDDLLELVYLAQKYALKRLESQCENRMVKTLRRDTVCKMLKAAEAFNLQHVKDHIVRYIRVNRTVLKRNEWTELLTDHPDVAIEILAHQVA